MLDFLKLEAYDADTISYFKENPLLEWFSNEDSFNYFDREVVRTKVVKTYKGALFSFPGQNKMVVCFSPHYIYNLGDYVGNQKGKHNSNDFSVSACIDILSEFLEPFPLYFSTLKVVNLEFGVNIQLRSSVKDLVTFLAYHEKNEFRTDAGAPFSKKSQRFQPSGRPNWFKCIKAYAKSLHYPEFATPDTFRFEVKSKQSKYINTLGVSTFADLLKPELFDLLGDVLVNEFDKVLILDGNVNTSGLTAKEKERLSEYQNPNKWYIINNLSRNSFSQHKARFSRIMEKTGRTLKDEVAELMKDKIRKLKMCNINSI
jgi:hypothetical protein